MNNENEKKIEEEVKDILVKGTIMQWLEYLIANKIIDKDKVNDKEYISKILKENYNEIKSPYIQVELYSELRKSIQDEIRKDRESSAVILTSVCIEHLINHFYQDLLNTQYEMSTDDIIKVLRSVNIPGKVGWLFKITTGIEIPVQLSHKIININSIRNERVHYKAITERLEDNFEEYDETERKFKDFKLDQLIDITYELESFLNKTLLDRNDNYRLSIELWNKYLS